VFHEQNIEQEKEEEEEMDGLTIPPNHEIGSSRKSVRRERSRKEIRSRIQIFEVVLVDLIGLFSHANTCISFLEVIKQGDARFNPLLIYANFRKAAIDAPCPLFALQGEIKSKAPPLCGECQPSSNPIQPLFISRRG